MKSKPLLAILVLALLLEACQPGSQVDVARSQIQRVTSPDVPPPELQELVAGNNVFAMDMYRALNTQPGNLFFSPYSISTALAMTYAGARGETARQMAETLHFTLPQERLHPAVNALEQSLAKASEGADKKAFRLHGVNSLWGQKGYSFLPDFLDLLARHYGAGMQLVDFVSDPESARRTINDWISQQTEKKIQNLIPPGSVNQLTRLVLANAIYFKASWQYPFEHRLTTDGPFYLLDGSEVQVPMMRMSRPAILRYAQGEGYQAVELPYVGERMSMLILVPDAGRFSAFETSLDAGKLQGIIASMEPQQVDLTLPRFRYEFSVGLAGILAEMGMSDAVDPGRADFSGIDGSRNLYISGVFHKAFVVVDEAGTEAAAATAVVVGLTGLPVTGVVLRVDRPFIFLIRDTETGSILFLGRVLNPAG